MEKYKPRKFDIKTIDGSVICGAIYTEKPGFNYSEELKNKDKITEIKKLKELRAKICTGFRINKIDMIIDEKKFRLITSRGIVVRNASSFKELGLFPAIIEETPELEATDIEIEYL